MRSRLLYVVPIVFTAGSSLAQEAGYGYPPGYVPGPSVQVGNQTFADGPNALYPVKAYIIQRTPMYVPPNQTIINNNVTYNYGRPAAKRPHRKPVYKPPCNCQQ